MLADTKARLPKLFNCLNLATIRTGRPSPLEAPDSVQPDRELLPQWKEWLRDVLPKEREGWEKRLEKRATMNKWMMKTSGGAEGDDE